MRTYREEAEKERRFSGKTTASSGSKIEEKLDSQAKKRLAERLSTPGGPHNNTRSRRRASIRSAELSASPTLDRPDDLVQVTPGLIVRKRRRSTTDKEEGSAAKLVKMDDISKKLDRVMTAMGNMQERMVEKKDMEVLHDRMSGLEEGQRKVVNEQELLHKRICRLENGTNRSGPSKLATNREENPRFVQDFLDARRSLMFSPVVANAANLKDFFLERMGIPPEVVRDLELSNIRQIHAKKLPAHREQSEQQKKTSVSFRDSYERDLIISYASNLRDQSKMEIVIPCYLASVRSQLDAICYRIRQHAKKTGGSCLTSLRLDDATQGLVAAVREKKTDQWLFYTLQELKQLESTLTKTPPSTESTDDRDEV